MWAYALVLGGLAAFSGLALIGLIFVPLANSDFFDRSDDKKILYSESENAPLKIEIIIHRALPDENAVEASVGAVIDYDSLPPALKEKEGCVTIGVSDNFSDFYANYSGVLKLNCVQHGELRNTLMTVVSGESALFKLRAVPSVDGYPFDSLMVLPRISIDTADGNVPAAVYLVEKRFSGRSLSVKGRPYNWEVDLNRSFVEKATVVGISLTFVVLMLLVTVRLFWSRDALTGSQELIAVAGFAIAVSSIHDVLGFSRLVGTSSFEIFTLVLPLVFLAAGIIFSAVRGLRAERNPQSSGPSAGRPAS